MTRKWMRWTQWTFTALIVLACASAAQAAATCDDSDAAPPSLAEVGIPDVSAGPILEPGFAPQVCTATATCGVHPNVSCQGSSTCVSVNRNCVFGGASQTGYVRCDGVTTSCPQDLGCTLACLDEFEACTNGCITIFPCVENCIIARSYCACNC